MGDGDSASMRKGISYHSQQCSTKEQGAKRNSEYLELEGTLKSQPEGERETKDETRDDETTLNDEESNERDRL